MIQNDDSMIRGIFVIARVKSICYNADRQNDEVVHKQCSKNPRSLYLRGFFVIYVFTWKIYYSKQWILFYDPMTRLWQGLLKDWLFGRRVEVFRGR